MRRLISGALVVFLALLLVSCGAKYMIPQDPMPKPSEGKALVNFIRPSWYGKAMENTIWDGEKLIGVVYGQQTFQYECDPGEHLFISWSEYKSPVEADLLPNRVYYVVLETGMGGWRIRVHQIPVNPSHELWQDALTWQKTLPNYTVEKSALAQIEAEGHAKIIKYIDKYHTKIVGTKHVKYLRPEDGVPVE